MKAVLYQLVVFVQMMLMMIMPTAMSQWTPKPKVFMSVHDQADTLSIVLILTWQASIVFS